MNNEDYMSGYEAGYMAASTDNFQRRVGKWMNEAFSNAICNNRIERAMRFFEESTELCQSLGMTQEQAQKLIDYVFSRAIGDPHQEVGGVMVTLAALGNTINHSISHCGETELTRINQPEILAKIRAKQVTKAVMGITPEDLKDG